MIKSINIKIPKIFSVITICSRPAQTEWIYRNDLFQPILIEECGLCEYPSLVGDWYCDDDANTPECQYDGGDCCTGGYTFWCIECVCYEESTQKPSTFQDLIKRCIESNESIDLTYITSKLKYPRDEYIQATLLQDSEPVNDWNVTEDTVWTQIFSPELGLCHQFDLRNTDQFASLPLNASYYVVCIELSMNPNDKQTKLGILSNLISI